MYIKQGSHTNISAYVQSVAHAALYFWVINKLSSDPFFYDFLSPFFTKHFFLSLYGFLKTDVGFIIVSFVLFSICIGL